MRPTNERPDLLLPDGAPVRCWFFAWGDGGRTDECETNATAKMTTLTRERFRAWCKEHPKAIIGVWPGDVYLCDTHAQVCMECIA